MKSLEYYFDHPDELAEILANIHITTLMEAATKTYFAKWYEPGRSTEDYLDGITHMWNSATIEHWYDIARFVESESIMRALQSPNSMESILTRIKKQP